MYYQHLTISLGREISKKIRNETNLWLQEEDEVTTVDQLWKHSAKLRSWGPEAPGYTPVIGGFCVWCLTCYFLVPQFSQLYNGDMDRFLNLWVAHIWRSGSEAVDTWLWATKLVGTSFGFGIQPTSLARSLSTILLLRTNTRKDLLSSTNPHDQSFLRTWLGHAFSRTFHYKISFRKFGIQWPQRTLILTFCLNSSRLIQGIQSHLRHGGLLWGGWYSTFEFTAGRISTFHHPEPQLKLEECDGINSVGFGSQHLASRPPYKRITLVSHTTVTDSFLFTQGGSESCWCENINIDDK